MSSYTSIDDLLKVIKFLGLLSATIPFDIHLKPNHSTIKYNKISTTWLFLTMGIYIYFIVWIFKNSLLSEEGFLLTNLNNIGFIGSIDRSAGKIIFCSTICVFLIYNIFENPRKNVKCLETIIETDVMFKHYGLRRDFQNLRKFLVVTYCVYFVYRGINNYIVCSVLKIGGSTLSSYILAFVIYAPELIASCFALIFTSYTMILSGNLMSIIDYLKIDSENKKIPKINLVICSKLSNTMKVYDKVCESASAIEAAFKLKNLTICTLIFLSNVINLFYALTAALALYSGNNDYSIRFDLYFSINESVSKMILVHMIVYNCNNCKDKVLTK